ncbi:MAG TPA: hypothetical protein VFC19_01575 [Candidatus Limnocylindrales bacterium]|nr:hypothetical protein [Candidatus Limnocylindrales bacterium]
MTAPGRGSPAAEVELQAGTGDRVRREFQWRAVAAVVIAMLYLAAAVYGGYGITTTGDVGIPFLVFGVVGALAQLAVAAALLSARTAIAGDRYDRPTVTRARRSIAAVLVILAGGTTVALIAGTAALGAGLGGLTAAGLVAVFATTADGWRTLRHLG